jgi:uncharacterized protein
VFLFSTEIPFSVQNVYEYHANPGALDRLIPPWEPVEIQKRGDSLDVGTEVILANRLGPFRLKWLARHTQNVPPHLFQDVQVSGPFKAWTHTHRFSEMGDGRCCLTDEVDYDLPFGTLGRLGSSWIRRKLDAMFAYRHETTLLDLTCKENLLHHRGGFGRPRIAISGSSGFLGSRLCALASVFGFEVTRILRSRSGSSDQRVVSAKTVVLGEKGFDQPDVMEGIDAVVHLGGYGIAQSRWSERTKSRILESRVLGTRSLVNCLKELKTPPGQFVCASGMGAYGEQGDAECDDRDKRRTEIRPNSFLEHVCQAWETEVNRYGQIGNAAVARLGVVLHPREGALAKMLPLFRFGLGGKLGTGKQYWSCVDVDDAIGAILFLALKGNAQGVYNVCSPEPITNQEFTKTLATKLHRPAWLATPAIAIKVGLGQMGKELLLTSTRGIPGRLAEAGYEFRFPRVSKCLDHLMGLSSDVDEEV